MIFTDDDLKLAQKMAKSNALVRALIARLEAAEKAMNHFSAETVLNDCCHPFMAAWRKAAGK